MLIQPKSRSIPPSMVSSLVLCPNACGRGTHHQYSLRLVLCVFCKDSIDHILLYYAIFLIIFRSSGDISHNFKHMKVRRKIPHIKIGNGNTGAFRQLAFQDALKALSLQRQVLVLRQAVPLCWAYGWSLN